MRVVVAPNFGDRCKAGKQIGAQFIFVFGRKLVLSVEVPHTKRQLTKYRCVKVTDESILKWHLQHLFKEINNRRTHDSCSLRRLDRGIKGARATHAALLVTNWGAGY